MKKRIPWLLSLILIITLCGCAKSSSSTTSTPTAAPTATPNVEAKSEEATSKDGLFDPQETNAYYDSLKRTFSENGITGIDGVEIDESLLWAPSGELRALLVTALSQDLANANQALYDKYIPTASDYYVALVPNLFKEGSYSYYVLLLDGTDGLTFTYTPGSTAASYSELSGIGQQNIKNLSQMAIEVWQLTPDDFNSLMAIFDQFG